MNDQKTDEPRVAPLGAPTYGSGFGIAPYQHGPGYDALVPTDEDEPPFATRGARFAARLIDGLATLLSATPALLIYLLSNERRSSQTLTVIVGAIGIFVLMVYQWTQLVRTGQTIGKRATNIKVVKYDGRPIGFLDGVVLREWVVSLMGLVPVVGRFISLVDAAMIFGAKRRCLHDIIAKTKVIAIMPNQLDL